MTGRQDETVPVGPQRIPGMMPQKPGPEDIGHGCRPHGHAGVPGVRLLNHVHGQHPDRIDTEFIDGFHLNTFPPVFLDRSHQGTLPPGRLFHELFHSTHKGPVPDETQVDPDVHQPPFNGCIREQGGHPGIAAGIGIPL